MKNSNSKANNSNSSSNGHHHHTNGFLPTSLKFISSCIKTASSGVRSASASVAASISGDAHEHKDQKIENRPRPRSGLVRLLFEGKVELDSLGNASTGRKSTIWYFLVVVLVTRESHVGCAGKYSITDCENWFDKASRKRPDPVLNQEQARVHQPFHFAFNHQYGEVLWASFDSLELGPSSFKRVLLLGYTNGFQVVDVEDASNVSEIVSRRDDSVTFLQMQPLPAKSEGREGFRASHPLLLVVASDESNTSGIMINGRDGVVRDGFNESQTGNLTLSPTIVQFYSLRSHTYVHVLRFRSTVYMVRCSPHIVAVGLATQIYCFDALTLENKFSVLTYPVPQLGGQGVAGINIGLGPMAVGNRWLAYASDNPLVSNMGRLSPQSLTPLGVSPSTSPGGGSLVARYAMESSKQLATGLINLGDMSYKTLSRYYQDLIPDGSNSPVSSNPNCRVGRGAMHPAETDIAGMVVVKDFDSRNVVAQFRAHTSPISALCFDPSGTLLVTASIHGHNINIFRIMPSRPQSGSAKSYDWSSSHVHLYKLHRGITQAVIQDICFSPYSQWIAIISSKGTCHIFVLSPFGGDNVLQVQNSNVDGPALVPVVSLPWWSTPSLVNQHSFSTSPPSPVTLSVVSRIRSNNFGWLGNAASSAAGKPSIPSGAIAAVFHCCVPRELEPAHLRKVNTLEHLLVYTPCGHVVQYKLISSFGGEPSEVASSVGHPSVQMHDEELQVNVKSVQWWDVCRRADWPEREECISGITRLRAEAKELTLDHSDCENTDSGDVNQMKPHDPSHLYLSNAEVQMSSWRIPLWQKSKMYFFTMGPLGGNEQNVSHEYHSGEIEVEKVPSHEVEIRRKDLLPVFDHFHRNPSNWGERTFSEETYSTSFSVSHGMKETQDAAVSHSKSLSTSSVMNSDGGSGANFHSFALHGTVNGRKEGGVHAFALPPPYQTFIDQDNGLVSFEHPQMGTSPVQETNSVNSNVTSLTNGPLTAGRAIIKEAQSISSGLTSEASNTSSNRSDLSMNIIDEGPVNDSLDFEPFFHEGYCRASASNKPNESNEVVNNNLAEEKCEEDGDSDDMLGGVFDFSEEG